MLSSCGPSLTTMRTETCKLIYASNGTFFTFCKGPVRQTLKTYADGHMWKEKAITVFPDSP